MIIHACMTDCVADHRRDDALIILFEYHVYTNIHTRTHVYTCMSMHYNKCTSIQSYSKNRQFARKLNGHHFWSSKLIN